MEIKHRIGVRKRRENVRYWKSLSDKVILYAKNPFDRIFSSTHSLHPGVPTMTVDANQEVPHCDV